MNTGGRRRPLGPLASGLACCALVVAVLSIWLSTGVTHAPVDSSKVTTITQVLVVNHVTARPTLPDHVSTPAELIALVVAVGFVLLRHRRAVPHHPSRDRRPPRRAPPGPLTSL